MNGLSSKEVLESRELYGSNKLPEPEMKKWYDFAKEALSEKITMILIAIAVLQLFLGFMGVMELSDRRNGEWKFNAVGSGFAGGLSAICRNFGLNL